MKPKRHPLEIDPLPQPALDAMGIPGGTDAIILHGIAAPVDTPAGRFWVKTPRPGIDHWAQRMLPRIRRLLPVDILKPAPRATIGQQAERARQLHDAGFHTARIVYCDDLHLILANAGETLTTLAHENGTADDEILRVTETLAELHAHDLVHGRPKMRDFAISAFGDVVLLDLEEQPWLAMPLETAQARDTLLWLLDLYMQRQPRDLVEECINRLRPTMRPASIDVLSRISRRVNWIARAVERFASNREMLAAARACATINHHITRNPPT